VWGYAQKRGNRSREDQVGLGRRPRLGGYNIPRTIKTATIEGLNGGTAGQAKEKKKEQQTMPHCKGKGDSRRQQRRTTRRERNRGKRKEEIGIEVYEEGKRNTRQKRYP